MKKFIIATILCISWELNAQVALPTFQAVHYSGLYSFSSHTFTNCGATGYNGPTLANCKSSYDTSWEDDTDFFNVQTQGFQEWTVPANGTYSFVLKGASGGGGYISGSSENRGGYGSQVSGSVTLTQGHVIKIVIGQKGGNSPNNNNCTDTGGGGGGGSFVYNYTTSTLLFTAAGGGGGGTYTTDPTIRDASLTTTGKTSSGTSGGAGGTNGAGGGVGGSCGTYYGAGGGGYSGSGTAGGTYDGSSPGGTHFTSTAVGGNGSHRDGGFGGGGSSSHYAGGGGGGYSGGGGGGLPNCNCQSLASGGGGSSYDSTSNATISLLSSSGHGQVTITRS